jgi:hypothetical protein
MVVSLVSQEQPPVSVPMSVGQCGGHRGHHHGSAEEQEDGNGVQLGFW